MGTRRLPNGARFAERGSDAAGPVHFAAFNSSGSLAMLTAMRRASSRVSSLAAERCAAAICPEWGICGSARLALEMTLMILTRLRRLADRGRNTPGGGKTGESKGGERSACEESGLRAYNVPKRSGENARDE